MKPVHYTYLCRVWDNGPQEKSVCFNKVRSIPASFTKQLKAGVSQYLQWNIKHNEMQRMHECYKFFHLHIRLVSFQRLKITPGIPIFTCHPTFLKVGKLIDLTFGDIFYPLYIPINFHRAGTGKIAAKFPHVDNSSVERLRKTCNTKSISAWEGKGMDTDVICTEDGKANKKGRT